MLLIYFKNFLTNRLLHSLISSTKETFDYRDRLYLVLELCSGGDLYTRDPYDEGQACNIIFSVVDAVGYMHSKGITHRDLKLENIMFANPSTHSVKVIDFGLSRKYAMMEHLHDTVGKCRRLTCLVSLQLHFLIQEFFWDASRHGVYHGAGGFKG